MGKVMSQRISITQRKKYQKFCFSELNEPVALFFIIAKSVEKPH
jgi:hypothetical protein